MLKCEKCQERAATVFITRVVDRQSTQARLCEECAREEAISIAWLSGASVPPEAAEMPLKELLMELLTSAPDPDSFGPQDDKWSLQKLAAYDQLQSRGEFPGDEDLADEADEMDDEDIEGVELSPHELQAALDDMEPGEREAVSQMLEALDEVQEQLESIMFQHAQDMGSTSPEADDESEAQDSVPPAFHPFFHAELMMPGHIEAHEDDSDPFADDAGDDDPFVDDDEDEEDEEDEDEEDMQEAEPGEPLLPTFLLPGFLGFGDHTASPSQGDSKSSQGAPEFKSAPSQRCPRCRTTWDRLREDGRAGCAACYELFEEPLGEAMERGQSASQHIGKAPRSAARRQKRLELLRARRDSRLVMLRERLKTALAAQQFEEAAKLRDKIKVVESTIVDPEGTRG